MIDTHRIKTECNALGDSYQAVTFDVTEGWGKLESIPLPEGWNRQTTTVCIEFPKSYPHRSPKLFVPAELRFNDTRPQWLLWSKKDGWDRYDPHLVTAAWVPDRDSSVTALRAMMAHLRNPGSINQSEDK